MEENLVHVCFSVQTCGSVMDRRAAALLSKALIRSLSRINKDGGIQQPYVKAGVTSADRQDKLLLANLSPYANQASGGELRAARH